MKVENIKPAITARRASSMERLIPNPKARLRDQFHEVCRFRRLAVRTEETYWGWALRFLRFHRKGSVWTHPRELGPPEIQQYLSHLATHRNVAASTQNQALNALVFLFQEVLCREAEDFGQFVRAKCSRRLPSVLTKHEVTQLFGAIPSGLQLPVRLLYGTGMRLMELLRYVMQKPGLGVKSPLD